MNGNPDARTSNLGVCPDCGGAFNGEFMHKPEHCKRQVMEWLSKIASKLDEEDASKVLLAGHTINRVAAERDRLRAALKKAQSLLEPARGTDGAEGDTLREIDKALSGEPGSAHETTAVPAITLLEKELQADRAYAWSWHCNIAVPIMDQFGCSHESANRSAAELMRHLFHVDVTTFPEWKAFGWNQDKCECGCCLPAPGAVCAGCGKRAAEKASGEPDGR